MKESNQKLAAIDLGSNSFHLVVASLENNSINIIDSVKDMVRLANGLDDRQSLSEEKIEEACKTLQAFGQRIKDFSPRNVHCVGTNTLRKATNSHQFLLRAEQALGFPIHIIGGREEARLVFQGVGRSITQTVERRLVIDIGGGSSEFIIGEINKPLLTESLTVGSVNLSNQFFHKGKITKKRVKKAVLAARQKLEWISAEYVSMGWQETIGSSGTIKAVSAMLDARFNANGEIKYKQLQKLTETFIKIKYIEDIEFEGLSSNRAPIIIGGICVLLAAFEELGIKKMTISNGALREGLLHDIRNVADGKDIRIKSVENMMQRYKVDRQQIDSIKSIASVLTQQLDSKKQFLSDKNDTQNIIDWTINLHEVGLGISHVNTAAHSAYIVEQSDMPGFSRGLQNTIGLILRLYRGKIKKKLVEQRPNNSSFSIILFIVRISILLARGRSTINLDQLYVNKDKKKIELIFPENYLENHPLTVADLEYEKEECTKIKIELTFRDSNIPVEVVC